MNQVVGGDSGTSTPRSVSRGVKLQLGYLGLDSLYLVVEYPSDDVYRKWGDEIGFDLDNRDLYQGVPCGEYLLRRGNLGYKLSVWDGDARLFLTDRVADNGPQGMGLMLQLGPKWLTQFGSLVEMRRFKENVYGQLALFGVKKPEEFPIRLNRMDITVDLIGLAVPKLSIDEWRRQWVGFTKLSAVYFARKSGELQGLTVGTSTGSVRFKLYDKVAEARDRKTLDFWCAVWSVAEEAALEVGRLEWTVKCYEARFTRMRYLSDLTFTGFLSVLNYVTKEWGRLCVPQADANRSRWPLAPLWKELYRHIETWSYGYPRVAKREYPVKTDVDYDYIRSMAGWLAGLQARVGLEAGRKGPVSVAEALRFLGEKGYTAEALYRKADHKLAVLSRLAGSQQLAEKAGENEEGEDEAQG